MALNAEALECRAAAVQLQQEARKVLSKALGPIGGAMAAWDFADCMGWI